MAKNGLSTFLHAELNADEKGYGEVKKLAGAISYKETLTKNDAEVYSDNKLKIKDTSVTGGTLELGVDDDDPVIFSPLLGRKTKKIMVDGKEAEVNVGNTDDIPIYVGFGFVENERNEKGSYYTVNFYPKVSFEPYDKENQTKQKTSEYKTPTITGTIYNLDNGDYKYDKRYTTILEALKMLYALFGKTIPDDLAEQYINENNADTDTAEGNTAEENTGEDYAAGE